MNRRIKQGAAAATVVAGMSVLGAGCLTRPVETSPPNLKTNFSNIVHNNVIDKIDLLFDIDNSASMGDKQQYLSAAIPDLINRLINPNCVDDNTMAPTGTSMNGMCPTGSQVEFPPVHDMHIGIVSSALGSRLGNECVPSTNAPAPFNGLSAHNDNQAHLLSRSLTYNAAGNAATEGSVADAQQGFLYWFPTTNTAKSTGGTTVGMSATLASDFTSLVGGVGVFGCGIESQLESWYRFLVQPDPYGTLVKNGSTANWSGVDTTILQQRHDFLRPDSLVAVIVLSDENDSEVDVRSIAQEGFNWMATTFEPPRGTSACGDSNGMNGTPGAPACMSCAQNGAPAGDPNCKLGNYAAVNDWGYDLNLRHVHTKAKYGIDPQFPIQRYVNGLTSAVVPDRDGEYPGSSTGNITSTSYVGKNDCTNPLFAASLPNGSGNLNSATLCQLPVGPRTKDLVFYAHIGGVPWQLLHFDPTSSAKSVLSDSDWVKILGQDPLQYNYSGIDPHMIESFTPRNGLPAAGSGMTDPINGDEWVTNAGAGHVLSVDREYACTFELADTMGNPTSRDCTMTQNQGFCDCPHVAGMVSAQQLPPICDSTTQTKQTGAKAYPTIRELEVAHMVGTQGIVSSICPIHVKDQSSTGKDDPLYGYRPAVAVIIDRLKNALTNQCLPEQLQQTNGAVPCLILVQLPPSSAGGPSGTCKNPTCDNTQGLVGPGQTVGATTLDPAVLNGFCDTQEAAYKQQVANLPSGTASGLQDPAGQSVCALVQLTQAKNPNDFASNGSCKQATDPGWCYVSGTAAGSCPQALLFTAGEPPHGATVNLQCLEQSVSVLDGGTAAAATTTGSGSSSGSGGSTVGD